MSYFRLAPFGEDYISIDFTRDFEADEVIDEAVWELDNLVSILEQKEAKRATIFLTGGADGNVNRAVCRVTTSLGRVIVRTEFVETSP